jgi:hypothetical protein
MIPPPCPAQLNAASRKCFRQVLAWIEREAAAARAPFVVGIGGPGGCGKSTLAHWLSHHLPGARILALDDFRLPRPRRPAHGRYGSHPDANDLARLEKPSPNSAADTPSVSPSLIPPPARPPRKSSSPPPAS